MKKPFLTLFLFFLAIVNSVAAQQVDSIRKNAAQLQYKQYMAKYKTNRTSGSVFLGLGLGMTAIGGIIFANYAGQGFNGSAPVGAENVFFFIGPATTLVSIPFFISASRYKKKAALVLKGEPVMLRNEPVWQLQYTAVGIRVSF